MQVELEVRRDGEVPRRLVLGPGVTHLGRAPDNDLVLPDVGVSRRHARLVVREGAAVLEDLGSGNGTFVRGERIRRHPVADGDQVVIDPFILQFHLVLPAQDARRPEEEETAVMDQVASGVELDDLRRGRLVVLQGHGLVAAYPLGPQGLTLGRSDERDIVLHEPAASRMQADIRAQEGVYWLRDFGSANGTFVNGRRVRERPLQHGDRIRIGSTEFRFELQDVGSAGPAVPAGPPAPAPAAPAPVVAPLPTGVTVSASPLPRRSGGGRGLWIGLGVLVALAVLSVGALGTGWWAWTHYGADLTLLAQGSPAADVAVAEAPPAKAPPAKAPVAETPPAETPAAEVAAAKAPAAEAPAAEAPAAKAPAAEAPAAKAPAAAAPPAEGSTEALMASGMAQFRKAAYLEATALFYKALKQDPDNVEAERMCYVSCEFLAIRQLRDDLAARQVPPEERERLYTEAVQAGRRAVRGRGDADAAEAAIVAALAWYPEDPTLVDLQKGIQSMRARSGGTRAEAASAAAEVPTSSASSAEARLARQYLDEGLQAIQDGRFVVARDRLVRAVALDGSLSAARSNLADVERVLEDRARNAWAQGQSLEARGDKSGAIAAYQQVLSYAGASQGSLKQQAQERLDALGA